MTYLQFDNNTLCNTPYPLNEIKYRLTFYKISGLGYNLNEIKYTKDGSLSGYAGIRHVALGIPLGVIFNQYGLFPYRDFTKRGSLSLRVGFENVFAPFDPTVDPDQRPIRVSVHGDDIAASCSPRLRTAHRNGSKECSGRGQ